MDNIVTLQQISNDRKQQYKELVTSIYSNLYDDVDDTMAGHILMCHNKGNDPFGYFTISKTIFEVFAFGECIGFTTLTLKRGGSAKTGPTILFPEFRGKSVGPQVQMALAEIARCNGCRKIYGTCTTLNSAATRYMIKSRYKIEAYLRSHYSNEADEIVFGKWLLPQRIGMHPNIFMEERTDKVRELSVDLTDSVSDELQELFAKTILEVNKEFVHSLLMGTNTVLTSFHEKPRRVLAFLNQAAHINSTAILIPKRGKSIKCNILGFFDSKALEVLINWVNLGMKPLGFRKLSVFVPANFVRQTELLSLNGFCFEGRLSGPYRENIDMDVFSLFLR